MKTTTLLKTLPVLGLTLALGACGGGDDDPGTGSITACFTADRTVNYAMKASNVPSGQMGISRGSVGPMTYNGQAVTGQTAVYVGGNTTYTEINYWAVTSNGVAFIAKRNIDGSITPNSLFFPQNMSPGQTVVDSGTDRYTLVGFETLSLAGKTFSNTCHIKAVDPQESEERWYAPGYGEIKIVHSSGVITQYNGDL